MLNYEAFRNAMDYCVYVKLQRKANNPYSYHQLVQPQRLVCFPRCPRNEPLRLRLSAAWPSAVTSSEAPKVLSNPAPMERGLLSIPGDLTSLSSEAESSGHVAFDGTRCPSSARLLRQPATEGCRSSDHPMRAASGCLTVPSFPRLDSRLGTVGGVCMDVGEVYSILGLG